ncbi:hypothetical protein [Paracoccus sp. KR1-242]|uniref:hypothetical protein n=1 Tax=Paracoccus sp. KR1-242 TaxID=3410028 RepID=UPI003C04E1FE
MTRPLGLFRPARRGLHIARFRKEYAIRLQIFPDEIRGQNGHFLGVGHRPQTIAEAQQEAVFAFGYVQATLQCQVGSGDAFMEGADAQGRESAGVNACRMYLFLNQRWDG